MQKTIYLDHAATTAVHPEVVKEMMLWFNHYYGNPSSIYGLGRESADAIAKARESVAKLINAPTDSVYFTGCGTESDNWAVKGTAFANEKKGSHLVTTAVEHHAVLDSVEAMARHGFGITLVPVDHDAMVDPDVIRKAITHKTTLVSVMHANNEVGTIQPIEEIAKVCREKGVLFHTDAVQTTGNYLVDVEAIGCDLLSISAHKLYGPKGVGVLYIRKGTKIEDLRDGGGQERKRRAGTENVAGIVALGKAAEIALADLPVETKHCARLRDRLRDSIFDRIDDVKLNGHPTERLPNNLNVSIAGIEGEAMMLRLDMHGICTSTGSACTTGNLEPSHVLMAMGMKHELAHGSQRFTVGRFTTEAEVDYALDVFENVVRQLRAMSPMYQAKS